MQLNFGMIEDRNDPLELGRYRVRVFGIHTHDKIDIPTEALPWASVLQPATSAGSNGVGQTPKLILGSHVAITFLDEDMQNPLILGSIVGLGQTSNVNFNGQDVPNNHAYGFTNTTDSGYLQQADLSKSARSGQTENLRTSLQVNNIAGAFSEPADLRPFRQYPYSQVRQSESGHLEEWDDTPGNERISTQHKSGTFTEMRPDGDNVTKITKDNYTIVAGDNNLYVSGSVNILVEGDINLTTEGDYNVNLGGDYNLRVQGNKFEHVNEDSTEVVNGNKSSYIVGSSDKTIGVDKTQTVVGSDTNTVYSDKTQTVVGSETNTVFTDKTTSVNGNVLKTIVGNNTETTKGNMSQNVTGTLASNVKGAVTLLSQSNIEVGSTSPVYVRGSTVDLNDTGASSFSFTDAEKTEDIDQITVYDQDFESIEADISVDSTSVTIKSSQAGTVDSETYVTATRNASTSQTNFTRTLNGKTESSYQSTAGVFQSGPTVASSFNNVYYSYSPGTKRDGKVLESLESILSKAAFASDVYAVEIYSGRQPGSAGRRTGSGRHDTGEAVDVRLIKTKEDAENTKGKIYVNGNTSQGQQIFKSFVQEGIKLGIRGGGFSRSYMGDYGMHLDTLGQIINTSNSRVSSSYDRNVLAVWKSTAWFREAFYTAEPDWKYFIALQSGTRYYSKTNTKWNRIA